MFHVCSRLQLFARITEEKLRHIMIDILQTYIVFLFDCRDVGNKNTFGL